MKKPFLYALGVAVYIIAVVLIISTFRFILPNENIFIPMLMLSLFVLSAAIMGFLFLSEPLQLLLENKKREAVIFFTKVVGIFACFTIILFVVLFLLRI